MGLHQAITNRVEAVPCDCGADDDHVVYTEADAEAQAADALTGEPFDYRPLNEEEDARPAEPEGFTTT